MKDLYCDKILTTPRKYLHQLAPELRKKNDDIFTDEVAKSIENNNSGLCVITDWRYKRELERMRELFKNDNIITIWIDRKDVSEIEDNIEVTREDCDYILTNKTDEYIVILREMQDIGEEEGFD